MPCRVEEQPCQKCRALAWHWLGKMLWDAIMGHAAWGHTCDSLQLGDTQAPGCLIACHNEVLLGDSCRNTSPHER